MSSPACWRNSSAAVWVEAPWPEEPKENLPGLALASSMKSASVRTPSLLVTTMTMSAV